MKAQLAGLASDSHRRRFRSFLQEELARRCAKNPRYSLRSFANHLRIDHSTLSQILRGKRRASPALIERLSDRLQVSRDAVRGYVANEAEPAESWAAKEIRQLTQEAATLLAEWHHYAILELTRVRDFRPDVRWIARVLGLTPDEVTVAVNRLVRLGLLEMTSRHQWRDTAGDAVSSLDSFSQRALRGLSDSVKSLASAALSRPAQAHQSATTLAVDSDTLQPAIARIERFRREIVALLEAAQDGRDEVYRLEISFFPLTDLQRKE